MSASPSLSTPSTPSVAPPRPAPAVSARKREVPGDFDRVASSYDLLTGANPGYHAHLRASARRLEAPRGARLLDLCCGTGASTDALLRTYPDADVVALDASAGMLARAAQKPHLRGVQLVHGDASDPAAAGVEGPFDGILMAYGIRNLPDPDAALANVLALLRPGGRIVFHEYSVADSALATRIWDFVCYGIIIPGGLVTSGSTRIYRYLHESVRQFDGVKAFEARLARAGYTDVWTGAMDGWQRGIVHSFVARRPS
jgi:ubiquinone/menaquinone biosynthesis C-methylase UbiE